MIYSLVLGSQKLLLLKFLQSILNLFYPKQCLHCHRHLLADEVLLCSACRHHLPETGFCERTDNPVETIFKGRVPIIQATALLFFRKKGISQELIHHLKYKGRQDVGVFFGKWMGAELKQSKRFSSLDVIIKVPLHPKKKKLRGYNQLTSFAEELSKNLYLPVVEDILIKVGTSTSQTKKGRFGRFEKIDEKFHCKDTKSLRGKHILLVDDVITTGATLEACTNELLKIPEVRISLAAMVISDGQ